MRVDKNQCVYATHTNAYKCLKLLQVLLYIPVDTIQPKVQK